MAGIKSGKSSVTGTSGQALPGGGLRTLSRKEQKIAAREAKRLQGTFESHPFLMAIKPQESYVFMSDMFKIDKSYAKILNFFIDDASQQDYGPFWGVDRVPHDLDEGVSVVMLEQVRKREKSWVDENIRKSEHVTGFESRESESDKSGSSRRKKSKTANDMDVVISELQDGSSYLHVHMRLLVKAKSKESLEEAVDKIRRGYLDDFRSIRVESYAGAQRAELSTLFAKNRVKRGKGLGFTSAEYAGSYHLVTNGLNDPNGEYVGSMVGDVNTSAVLFDVNDFKHHVVIADDDVNPYLNRAHNADLWGSKISQCGLLNNNRVIHIVLDGANLNTLGPNFKAITARLDMSQGDINMFEMFGDQKDELSIFATNQEKIVLMTKQIFKPNSHDESLIDGSLRGQLENFYIDKSMWYHNAEANRDRLRVVGIPHTQVPRLSDFVSYFDSEVTRLTNHSGNVGDMLKAANILAMAYRNMLNTNGALFNTYTSDEIDSVDQSSRVIYDFSSLAISGEGLAMAQLVNVIGFAVGRAREGDILVIHGAEHIDAGVKDYVGKQIDRLYRLGGRVAFCYNSVEKMLADQDFNKFDAADYTILGSMREKVVADYHKRLFQAIPADLERLITQKEHSLSYLRRNHTNVVFQTDLSLGVNYAQRGDKFRAASMADQALYEELLRTRAQSKAPQDSLLAALPPKERRRVSLGNTRGQNIGEKPVQRRKMSKSDIQKLREARR